MPEEFSRSILVLGNDSIEKLALSRVIVFGLGGVGGYVCEALARSGVGHFTIIDNDVVSVSFATAEGICELLGHNLSCTTNCPLTYPAF